MTPIELERPRIGFYLTRMVKDGPQLPCRIFRPCPIEMHDDVPWQWVDRWPPVLAERAGLEVPITAIWPTCARWPIDAAEFAYRMSVVDWAETHAPWSPEARPREAVDLNRMEPIF